MHLCYIDESGTIYPDNTKHYVLAGLCIPISKWKICENEISKVKAKYSLSNSEIHTGWLMWPYLEQNKINGFANMDHITRRVEVDRYRSTELLRLNKPATQKQYHKTKKNYIQSNEYTHLTFAERKSFVTEVARIIGNWGFCRIFCECIDKLHFNPLLSKYPMDEQAFEQVISRFEQFLKILSKSTHEKKYGILVHDNNPTVSKRHTQLMKHFHQAGTIWTSIENIVEIPFYVDSELTSMVQLADLCSYGIRRYLDNGEDYIFKEIFKRVDTKDGKTVGIRHFTSKECGCEICKSH